MKAKPIHRYLVFLLCLSLAGCGGESSEETPANAAMGQDSQNLGIDAEPAEEATAPEVGDVVCDGADVYMVGNGGVTVFIETCEGGLLCVEEAEGCACVPDCDGRVCGDDGCGGSCGVCEGDLLCTVEGECSDECLPDGDGKLVGNLIRDMMWQIPPAGGFSLHELCRSQEVIVLVEVAGW